MGSSTSKNQQGGTDYYSGAAQHYSQSKTGGRDKGELLGGDDFNLQAISEYADTLNSFTKQSLVSDIVSGLQDLGFKVSGSTTEEQIQDLIKKIPNSKHNKGSFSSDATAQAKICQSIAKMINKKMGKTLVDPSSPAPVICQSIAEIITSLRSGMQLEFLAVQDEVQKVLKNLLVLKEQLSNVASSTGKTVQRSHDEKFKTTINRNMSAEQLILTEIDRQVAMLQNLLSINIAPTEVKMSKLLADDKEMFGIIESLGKSQPGDAKFGQVISNVLTGLGITADFALVIDAALKKIGYDVKKYANGSLKDLKDHVAHDLLEKDMDDDQKNDYLRAQELLIKNFSRAKDIESVLESRTGSNEKMNKQMYNTWGGEEEILTESDYKKSRFDKRITNTREIKKIVFSTFSKSIDEHMYKIIVAIDNVAPQLGVSITLSDQLDGFRNSLTKLRPLLMRQNAYVSLMGYYNDALSRERRETFIEQLKLIVSYVDTLSQMSQYSQVAGRFGEVKSACLEMIKLLDTFSDKISQKFGAEERSEVSGGADQDFVGGDNDEVNDFVGGEEYYGGDKIDMPTNQPLRKVPKSMAEAIEKFDYFYKIAQINTNLKYSAKELDFYAEGYTDLRAEAIAKKIDGVKAAAANAIKILKDSTPLPGTLVSEDDKARAHVYVSAEDRNDPRKINDNKAKDTLRNSTIKFIERECEAKCGLWQTVEAIDEYMKVFTNDFIKNQKDMQTIKSMLDETEVIDSWYTNETGAYLSHVFDSFPCYIEGTGTDAPIKGHDLKVGAHNYQKTGVQIDAAFSYKAAPKHNIRVMPAQQFIQYSSTSSHYYSGIAQLFATKANGGLLDPGNATHTIHAGIPGNPFIVIDADSPEHGFSGITEMKKVVTNLAVLKNILSVFVHIGSKFGDRELHKKIFMTPTQIYKNLCDWMEVCSFGYGLGFESAEIDLNYAYGSVPQGNNLMSGIGMSVLEVQALMTPGALAYPSITSNKIKVDIALWPDITAAELTHSRTQGNYGGYIAAVFENALANPIPVGRIAYTDDNGTVYTNTAPLTLNGDTTAEFQQVTNVRPFVTGYVTAAGRANGAGLLVDHFRDLAILILAEAVVLKKVQRKKDSDIILRQSATLDLSPTSVYNLALFIKNRSISLVDLAKMAQFVLNLGRVPANDNAIRTFLEAILTEIRAVYVTAQGQPSAVSGGKKQQLFYGGNTANVKQSRTYDFDNTAPNWKLASNSVHVGVTSGASSAPYTPVVENQVAFRKKYGIYMRGVLEAYDAVKQSKHNFRGRSEEEDDMFVNIIKCMCAKVLTVTGMFDVKDRPKEKVIFNATRMIVGGSEDQFPEVIDKAMELYFRLPLLAVFYRDLFDFNSTNLNADASPEFVPLSGRPTRAEKISMLPETEGVFAALTKIVFKKAKNISINEYSDIELKELIREINKIWTNLSPKASGDAIEYIIHEYVNEINKSYGLVSEQDRNDYESETGQRLDYSTQLNGDLSAIRQVDVPLLPGEEDMDYEMKAVNPSRKYERGASNLGNYKGKNSGVAIQREHQQLINRFRCTIDAYFRKHDAVGGLVGYEGIGAPFEITGKGSFKPAIKSAQNYLKVEKLPVDRYKVVANMLRGSSILNKSDYVHHLLFHETVITGLNTLSALYSVLIRYQRLILASDVTLWKKLLLNQPNLNGQTASDRVKDSLASKYFNGVQNHAAVATEFDVPDRWFATVAVGAALANPLTSDAFHNYVNAPFIMQDLLEALYGIGNDLSGLVTVSVESKIMVNFSALKDHVEKLFESIKYFMNVCRDSIDPKIFDRYVDKYRSGSLYWLQEQLLEKLIIGRAAFNSRDPQKYGANKVEYVTLDDCNRILNNTMKFLATDQTTAAVAIHGGAVTKQTYVYGQLFAKQIFYDSQASDVSGVQPCVNVLANAVSQGVDYSQPMEKLLMQDLGNKQIVFPEYSNRFKQLYSWKDGEFSENGSLLMKFNELLARYLSTCYDKSTEKIYTGCINQFVNGQFNGAIMSPDTQSYPDMVKNNGGTGTVVRIVSTSGSETDPSFQRGYNVILAGVPGAGLGGGITDRVLSLLWNASSAVDARLNRVKALLVAHAGNADIATFLGAMGSNQRNSLNLTSVQEFNKFVGNYNAIFNGAENFTAPTTGGAALLLAAINQLNVNLPKFFKTVLSEINDGTLAVTIVAPVPVIERVKQLYSQFDRDAKSAIYTTVTTMNKDIPFAVSNDGANSDSTQTFGARPDPKPDALLYSSLAMTLKNILTSKNSTNQMPVYTLDNIAEVSMFKKEEFRVNLPIFRNMFKAIVAKGELIKQLTVSQKLSLLRENMYENLLADDAQVVLGANALKALGIHNLSDIGSTTTTVGGRTHFNVASNTQETQMKNFTSIINNLIAGCTSLIASIDSVLRELSDDPKYFEVHSGSIKEYKEAKGFNPLMPLSGLLHILNNRNSDNANDLLPVDAQGTDGFKIKCGTRLVLAKPHVKVQPEHVPGFFDIIDMFNNVGAREAVDKRQATEFMTLIVNSARYLNEFRNYKGSITPVRCDVYGLYYDGANGNQMYPEDHNLRGAFAERTTNIYHKGALSRSTMFVVDQMRARGNPNLTLASIADLNKNFIMDSIFTGHVNNTTGNNIPVEFIVPSNTTAAVVYAPIATLVPALPKDSLVSVVESSFKDDMVKNIAEYLAGNEGDHSDLAVKNLIDMNIVPINVHALMRDIPLANIYNYAYSFDRMIVELYYGLGSDFANFLIDHLCDNSGMLDSDIRGMVDRSVAPYNARGQVAANNWGKRQQDQTLIKSSKELFVAMLIKPYRKLISEANANDSEMRYLADMFRGDSNIPLGRPKFLGDQLFNKSLFGELYNNATIYNGRPVSGMRGPSFVAPMITQLTYPKINNGREKDLESLTSAQGLTTITVPQTYKELLKIVGKLRSNTVLARNLMFIVNAYRTLRHKLREDLMYNKGVIVSSNAVTREENTEFSRNQTQTHTDLSYDENHGYRSLGWKAPVQW